MTPRTASAVAALGALAALALLGPGPAVVAGAAAAIVAGGSLLGPVALVFVVVPAVVVAAAAGLDPVVALGSALAVVLVHLRIAPRDPVRERATVLVAGLLLLAVSAARDDVALLPCWLAFAVSLPIALTPGPVPVGVAAALSSSVLATAAAVFLGLPRLGDPPAPDLSTGFAPAVALDAFEHLEDDPTVVLTGTVEPPLLGRTLWRGLALDTFDGRTWTASAPAVAAFPHAQGGPPLGAVHVVVTSLDPTGVVFLPGRAWGLVTSPSGLAGDPLEGWRVVPPVPVEYDATVAAPGPSGAWFPPDEGDPSPAHVMLPPIDPRVGPLAARVAGEGTPAEQVGRLADWLRTHAAYTRHAAAHGDAVAAFLFDDRAGHCELFATALAVLARSRGIPARLVTGFAAESPPDGHVVIRRADAHAWVEILDPTLGWVPFDATPVGAPRVARLVRPAFRFGEGWQRSVVAWSHDDQVALARVAGLELVTAARFAVTPSGWIVVSIGVTAALVVAWSRRRRHAPRAAGVPLPTGAVARIHAQARASVAQAGWTVPPGLPPVAASHWLAERAPGPAADALEALAWLTYEVELGGAPGGPAVEPARALLAQVRLVPPVIRPGP